MILLWRELSIVFTVTCSHLWWGGEERQRPDPVPQLPWWLQAQQSVRVEDYCSSGLSRRPYLPVFWGKDISPLLFIKIVFSFCKCYDFNDISNSNIKPSNLSPDWTTWQLCLWLPGGSWRKLWKQSPARPILWLRQARWHQNQLQPAVDEICFRWLCQQGRLCCQLLQRSEAKGCKLLSDVFSQSVI